MDTKRKILIAEDSPTQALELQLLLESRDYEVLHGSNGAEALNLIDVDDLPDVIITDIMMPEMDGYEFCKAVKQNPKTKEIPVILLTSLSDPNDVIRGLQSNADNFISKPYSEEFLFERIHDILLNQDLRRRTPNLDISMEIFFAGQKHQLNSTRMQILDLLLSTYYNAINKNKELENSHIQLKRMHKELNEKNTELENSIEEKNHLIGIAAHDLRSPLNAISGLFALLTDKLKDVEVMSNQQAITSTIQETMEYMLTLVTDVLDYAKVQSSTLKLKKESFDFSLFMEKVIDLNRMLSEKKGIKIHKRYSMEGLMVNFDQNKMKQVMDNLLSNAIKYSEFNTNIEVELQDKGDSVLVKIRDEGKGIPDDEISNIFAPFVTTSVKATAGEESTGLGLVSVKKIIEAHEGEIGVESEEGKGSCFFFTIPKG